MPYSEIAKGYNNKISFLQATLENVFTNNTIEVKEAKSGQSKVIPFDYLVICTGAQYNEPIRTANIFNINERRSYVKDQQSKIAMAASVLVVGAGSTGVELLGELTHLYPSKKIGVV
jgi:NADH dehydrogenase FAD-containing subunit